MRAVNLLPDASGRESEGGAVSKVLTPTTVLAAGAVVVAAVMALLAFAYVSSHNTASDRRQTLKSLQQDLTDVQAKQAAAQAAASASAQAEGADLTRLTAFQAAASARIAWDDLLGDLSRVLPAGSWVSSLTMHAPPAALPATATSTDASATTTTTTATTATATPGAPAVDLTTFQVSGVALSNDIVAKVMQRLALVPMLSDITLNSSQRTDVGTRKAFQFAMSANLSPTGARP